MAFTIKDSESFSDFLLSVGILHLPGHHGEELREVNGPVAIRIHLVDHILELSFSGILTERPKKEVGESRTYDHYRACDSPPHDSPQLLGSDGAVTVFVEQREGLLELGNLIFSELFRHLFSCVKLETDETSEREKC